MTFLRTISTRRLVVLCVSVVVAAAACTAIALAATSGGPKPPPKPLAVAVHDALTAPEPQGVTATVSFKNRLIDSAAFEGSDPLISGGTGRLWATPDGHLRIEVQSTSGDAQLVSDGKTWWAYDPSSNTVYKGTVPQDKHHDSAHQPPTIKRIQQSITKLQGKSNVSGARPANVGGRPAYDVRVSPKLRGGLFGGASLAWDAIRGVPLRGAVYARGQSSPVLSISVTGISFGKIDSSALDVSPPPGAKTVDLTTSGHGTQTAAPKFTAVAPASLAGRKKQEVKQLREGGAIVTYGTGPGAIAVIEKPSDGQSALKPKAQSGDHRQGFNLPTVSIGGVTGLELSTPLGTAIRFDRGGISYTVLGSLNASTVLAAARGL